MQQRELIKVLIIIMIIKIIMIITVIIKAYIQTDTCIACFLFAWFMEAL